MLRIPIICFLLLISGLGYAQNFKFSKQIKGDATGKAMGIDHLKNIYIGGDLSGIASFGKINGKELILESIYSSMFIVKFDSTGKLLWGQNLGGGTISDLIVDKAGNIFVTGIFSNKITWGKGTAFQRQTIAEGGSDRFIAKYSANGSFKWVNHIKSSSESSEGYIKLDYSGNVFFIGNFSSHASIEKSDTSSILILGNIIAKLNPQGRGIWAQDGISTSLWQTRICLDKAGNSFLTADGTSLKKYDPSGKLVWKRHIFNETGKTISEISIDGSGNIYIVGKTPGASSERYLGFFVKVNNDGIVQWSRSLIGANGNVISGIKTDFNGNLFITGSFDSYCSFDGTNNKIKSLGWTDLFVAKYNNSGHLDWVKTAGGDQGTRANKVTIDDIGQVFVMGTFAGQTYLGNDTLKFERLPSPNSYGVSENTFFSVMGDNNYSSFTNVISGNIYSDNNSDCLRNPNEPGMQGIIVKAEPGGYYGASDSLGNYTIEVSKGAYVVNQIVNYHIGKVYYPSCTPSTQDSIRFLDYDKKAVGPDFGYNVINKPFITVDIASNRRRRCFKSLTTVSYCNEGYADANNVQIKVEYPEFVVPITSSLPWNTQQGKILSFNIGVLKAGECKSFVITDSVVCGNEGIRGLTQCVKVHITPKNNDTPPDSRWDKSDIELKAICKENGFVRLTIKNTGNGNMSDSSAYRIFIDASLSFSSRYKLASKDSLVLNVPANSRVVRLEADVTPFHPSSSKPTITIEGCEDASTARVSKGYLDQLPQNDEAEEVEISCMQIIDSFDPNDKQVSPSGILDKHYINADDELEYYIRFQNTGTDTAYTVVVKDEMSEYLDISTLRVGAASHPFTWTLSGEGHPILSWTFRNINLPDSTTNEIASHGFVKFKIKQVANNPKGTIIKNKADIYFDYNSAVITNEVFNTIGIPDFIPAKSIIVQNCSQAVNLEAGTNFNTQVCGSDSSVISAPNPKIGYGTWKISKGEGKIADAHNIKTVVDDLSYGENEVVWRVDHCDQKAESTFRIERMTIPEKPQAYSPPTFCKDEPIVLTLAGEKITWYKDKSLSDKIAESSELKPKISETTTFYVTQKVNGCESEATEVLVKIQDIQKPTIASSFKYCKGDEINLSAEGESLKWYSDPILANKIGEGTVFKPAINPGTINTYYVTQTINGCESLPVSVNLSMREFKMDKAFIPNIITPNGDEKNDDFYFPDFEEKTCLGAFQRITIVNRWGKKVFESKEENFKWEAKGIENGVFFYTISYKGLSFTGNITVLK